MNNRLCLLLFAALAPCSFGDSPPAKTLERLYASPRFQLTDQNGRAFSDTDLRGKTWVVDFVFTRCPGACPRMTQKMIDLATKVPAPEVRFVSISVDPANDTPEVLTNYARLQGATDPRMIFLTGDPRTVYGLINDGFKVAAKPASPEKPIIHDEHFLLIDGNGFVRGAYRSDEAEAMKELAADATQLAKESPWLARFPALNASLNATSGILLCLAMIMIQVRWIRAHAWLMVAAVVSSTAFLACYLTYHYLKHQAGAALTTYPDVAYKTPYQAILISHTILAIVVIPLIVMTLVRAWRRQWDRHRKIARPTFWIWLYVSATGVLVYWMLYQLAPRLVAAQA